MEEQKEEQTQWHKLLGAVLESLLTPVGIQVFTEFPVMSSPPKADILILRRDTAEWTDAQKERLPDGIRQSKAGHILIEFKYTESLNHEAFVQSIAYDYHYLNAKNLSRHDLQTCLISAKTPHKKTLEAYAYKPIHVKGVYESALPLCKPIRVIVLNDLSNEPYNVYFKCFATQMKNKRRSMEIIQRQNEWLTLPLELRYLLTGLWNLFFSHETGGNDMNTILTPEKVKQIGKSFLDAYVASLPVEERLSGIKPEDRLKGIKPEDRLKGIKPEDIMNYFKPEELLKSMKPEEITLYLNNIRKKK